MPGTFIVCECVCVLRVLCVYVYYVCIIIIIYHWFFNEKNWCLEEQGDLPAGWQFNNY